MVAGLQQALAYAEILDVPVAFNSNGDEFVQHDRSQYSQAKRMRRECYYFQ